MRANVIIASFLTAGLLSGCGTPEAPVGYGTVKLATEPIDADCTLKGQHYNRKVKSPATLIVPLASAPVQVDCRKIGYVGERIMELTYDPWSPANIGSLGIGYLLDQSSGTGRTLPKEFVVTLTFQEAGRREDVARKADTSAEKPAPKPVMEAKPKKAPTKAVSRETLPAKPDPPKTAKKKTTPPKPPKRVASKISKSPIPLTRKPAKKAMPKSPKPKQRMAKMPDIKPSRKAAMARAGRPSPSIKAKAAPAPSARVHVLSFKVKANAERSWKRLVRKESDHLGKFTPTFTQVDLGKKGLFYRVYAGPIKDYKLARKLCQTLMRRKTYCRAVPAGKK